MPRSIVVALFLVTAVGLAAATAAAQPALTPPAAAPPAVERPAASGGEAAAPERWLAVGALSIDELTDALARGYALDATHVQFGRELLESALASVRGGVYSTTAGVRVEALLQRYGVLS